MEVEDGDGNRPFSRETSPSSARFVAVETPASTAEPSSPAMTDRSAFPPTPSVEQPPSPADTAPAIGSNPQTSTPDTLRPVSPGRLSPRIDLSGFTPAELSQFLSSLIVPSMFDGSSTGDEPNQAITAYQPFDFGSYSPPPLALPSPKPLSPSQDLLSFPPEFQSQWTRTSDIDKDVKESSDSIASILDTFKSAGIDPTHFDDPLLDTSAALVNPEHAAAALPVSGDDTSFFDSFLNSFPSVPVPVEGDPSTSTDLPIQDEILPSILSPPIPSLDMDADSSMTPDADPEPKAFRGRKRKSDASAPKQPETSNPGRPKRRKEK